MTRLLSACLMLALASCTMTPVMAQQPSRGCPSLESVVSQADEVRAMGAEVEVLTGDRARAFVRQVISRLGPPPRDLSGIDTVVVMKGPAGAYAALVEGVEVCPPGVTLSRDSLAEIMRAVDGSAI